MKSNVHFPTDYNLLADSARKCLDMIYKFVEKHKIPGWRKLKGWYREIKREMRIFGKRSSSGGKEKEEKMKMSAQQYLTKANALSKKIAEAMKSLPNHDMADIATKMLLEGYLELLDKHIDLLDRRVLQGEQIPHGDKMFSIFEQYTEWINKGKLSPNVELGKMVSITSDQFNLIVHWLVMEKQTDSAVVEQIVKSVTKKFTIASWSFDKGYWSKENKELLTEKIAMTVLPKKGKCNKAEFEQQHKPLFKKLRNQHSAVESNINELEHRGLDRCPSKGYRNFKAYIGLSICAYNLKKIGEQILVNQREVLKKRQVKGKKAA